MSELKTYKELPPTLGDELQAIDYRGLAKRTFEVN